jgi:hypothetical protein
MEALYARLSEWFDKKSGTWWAMACYLIWCAVMPEINVDVANYGISVVSGFLLFLGVAGLRRNWKAMHAKADAIVKAVPDADDALERIEDRLEAEIDQARA